ncbi:unnamed protein product [Linum trigynum]|uniref:Uncharacterized protein n=1 Tax=Linum trigynum TaxID=586398 RepID=A0AAV2DYL1_9ROSI
MLLVSATFISSFLSHRIHPPPGESRPPSPESCYSSLCSSIPRLRCYDDHQPPPPSSSSSSPRAEDPDSIHSPPLHLPPTDLPKLFQVHSSFPLPYSGERFSIYESPFSALNLLPVDVVSAAAGFTLHRTRLVN